MLFDRKATRNPHLIIYAARSIYNKESGILHVTVKGVSDINDMLNALNYIKTRHELPLNLLILENAVGAQTNILPIDLDPVIKTIKSLFHRFETIRHAVIHKEPKSTAMAMMIEKMVGLKGFRMQVFSSEKAATAWLRDSIDVPLQNPFNLINIVPCLLSFHTLALQQ